MSNKAVVEQARREGELEVQKCTSCDKPPAILCRECARGVRREGAREALEKAAAWFEQLGASWSSVGAADAIRALLPPGEKE